MMWDNDYGWGAWLAMSIGMVAFWALIVVVLVAVVRSLRDDSPPGRPGKPTARRTVRPRRHRRAGVPDKARTTALRQSGPPAHPRP
jgi:hypothetical protein